MTTNAIQTIHKLDFQAKPYEPVSFLAKIIKPDGWIEFKVGTCIGIFLVTDKTYDIVAIENENPGNGHFEDVLQWFEHSCHRDKKNLTKRGFKWQGHNVIKEI